MSDIIDITMEAVAAPIDITMEVHRPGDGAGFDGDHNDLSGRDAADAHPMSAITGLEAALASAGGAATAAAGIVVTVSGVPTDTLDGAVFNPVVLSDPPHTATFTAGDVVVVSDVSEAPAVHHALYTVTASGPWTDLEADAGTVAFFPDTGFAGPYEAAYVGMLVTVGGQTTPQWPSIVSVIEDAGAPEWGDIGGTLSAQTDLDTALGAKLDDTDARVLPTPVGGTDGHVATIASGAWTIAAPSGGGGGGVANPGWSRLITPRLAETIPVWAVSQNQTLTSGRLLVAPIVLTAGQSITYLGWVSGTTALSGGTNQWFMLLNSSLQGLAVTVDDGSTAWGANDPKELAISGGPYVVPADGEYRLGIMVAAATPPTIRSVTVASGAGTWGSGNTAATGQTSPPSLPFSTTLSVPSGIPYGWVR